MEVTVLKDILISADELDRFYENAVPINLWRGIHIKNNCALFDLVEEPYILSNGKPRGADFTIKKNEKGTC